MRMSNNKEKSLNSTQILFILTIRCFEIEIPLIHGKKRNKVLFNSPEGNFQIISEKKMKNQTENLANI